MKFGFSRVVLEMQRDVPQIAGHVSATGTTHTSCTSNRAALGAECDVSGDGSRGW